jgi:hypothetical protein
MQPLSFERDIRPLFRETDRSAMLKSFDLWWYPDVVQHHEVIIARLADGSMPCDRHWAPGELASIRTWVLDGFQP